jgi:Asp-tRNA(Asn)/Glu-tRNA(Gln) amidotransferase B subunit
VPDLHWAARRPARAERRRARARAARGPRARLHDRAALGFARKNYFYCDLPKATRSRSTTSPIARGGGIELASGAAVRLLRIHMEEDAGKAIHDRGDATLVDLNRAGVPLIESVTEPDLASSDEAHEYLTRLREILVFAGVSDCDMEKGSLRCDVNVSGAPPRHAARLQGRDQEPELLQEACARPSR